MDRETYYRIWERLTEDLAEVRDVTKHRPVLAHYTSMTVIESFLKERRLWMSNPLNMNDHQEVSFGIHAAINEASSSSHFRQAFQDDDVFSAFLSTAQELYEDFGKREVKDLYVACFSEHEAGDLPDGKLSMWRAYGDFGDGAAIVFDTSKVTVRDDVPFVLSEVSYLSDEDRLKKIKDKVTQIAGIVASESIDISNVSGLAYAFFRRAALAAVFTKHIGFREENEWCLVYFPDYDNSGAFKDMIDYHNGPTGLQPKLKLLLEGPEDVVSMGVDLDVFISAIVIGPRVSSPLNLHAAKIMLEKIGCEALIPKLIASTIPFRR